METLISCSSARVAPLEPPPPPVQEKSAVKEPAFEGPVVKEPAVKEPAVEESAKTGFICELPNESYIRIQVSAKHLILASPVFKKIITGSWKESITYLQKGSVEINAEGWDTEALLILLRVIHCQYNSVPRKMTLEMLAKVAVLVDYYRCNEAMSICTDIWIGSLEEKIPTGYSRDLILWLWVSWIFQLSAQFKEATSTAMSLSNGLVDNLGLPIPDNVIGSMNDRRHEAIGNIVNLLYGIHEAFLSGTRGCSFECRSIMYGALTKHMQSSAFVLPRPTAPFPDLNYKKLIQNVLLFKSPRWSELSSSRYYHNCSDSSFQSLFGKLDDSIEGLDLHSLIP